MASLNHTNGPASPSHQLGTAYFTGQQMVCLWHYPHGTDAVPCTQGSDEDDDDYRACFCMNSSRALLVEK